MRGECAKQHVDQILLRETHGLASWPAFTNAAANEKTEETSNFLFLVIQDEKQTDELRLRTHEFFLSRLACCLRVADPT